MRYPGGKGVSGAAPCWVQLKKGTESREPHNKPTPVLLRRLPGAGGEFVGVLHDC
jgi:hypothetical protein